VGDLLNVDQIFNQMNGDFGKLVRDRAPAGRIQKSWQKAQPGEAIRTVRYDRNIEEKLRLREGAHTLIVLPDWETVSNIKQQVDIGSREALSVQPRAGGRILTLNPGHAGWDTTLTVIGDSGVIYAFYAVVENDLSSSVPDEVVYIEKRAPLNYAGPPAGGSAGAAGGAAAEGRTDYLRDAPFDAQKLDFAFTMSGDQSIAPSAVFSDGQWTYLHYGDRFEAVDLPVVQRVVDRIDTPVNTRVKGNTLIVESPVAEGLTLRNGRRVVCIRRTDAAPAPEVTPRPVAAAAPARVGTVSREPLRLAPDYGDVHR
jgi:type IV secretory pathway VirB9-like protein